MHAEEQIGHAMRQHAGPEAACLVEEEVVDSARHHAGEPEGMFTLPWNHRYEYMGWVALIVENGLRCCLPTGARSLILASIEIAIKAREVAGGNLETQTVPWEKHVARGPEVDRQLVHLASGQQCGDHARGMVARTDDAISQVLRIAVWAHIHQLRGEIRIRGTTSRAFRKSVPS
jgi:hypothetical protein